MAGNEIGATGVDRSDFDDHVVNRARIGGVICSEADVSDWLMHVKAWSRDADR